MNRWIVLFALVLTLAACGARQEAKRYPMQGEIKGLDPVAKNATISAGRIGDWMGPMTMEYPIKPDAEFAKLHVGDHIQAMVIVNDLKYYVTDVKIEPQEKPVDH
jgi:Cu/Ag efflux protein CusF